MESPTPPQGEHLPGAGYKLTPAQNGRHEGRDQGRPAWDIRGVAGSGVGQLPGIAQVTAYIQMPAGPICKALPEPATPPTVGIERLVVTQWASPSIMLANAR